MTSHTKSEIFWAIIEKGLQLNVPHHLKFIFKLQEVDKPDVFIKLNKDYFSFIENYVRSRAYAGEIPEGADSSLYYGTYSANNFQFSEKDSKLFNTMKQFIMMKGQDFWKEESRTEERTNSPEKS